MFTTKPLLTSLLGGTGALTLLLTNHPKADSEGEGPSLGTPPAEEQAPRPVIKAPVTPAIVPVTTSTDPLAPPLGLSWGGTPEELLGWAQAHGLTHRKATNKAGLDEILTLEITAAEGDTLPGEEATGLEAHYSNQRLFEMSLTFRYPDRAPSFVEHQFSKLRSKLGRRHGLFTHSGTHLESTQQSESEHRLFECAPAHNRTLGLSITESLDPNTGESEAHFRVHYHHGGISATRPQHKRRATEADETVA